MLVCALAASLALAGRAAADEILFLNGDRLTTLSSKVTGGADGTVQVVPVAGGTPQVIALKDVAKIIRRRSSGPDPSSPTR